MKLKRIRKIVLNYGILYPEKIAEIERKIKILNKRADVHKDAGKANKLVDKAEEWKTLWRLDYYNQRKRNG